MTTIDRLLEATPMPPAEVTDISELIAAADAMTLARGKILAVAEPATVDATLLAELELRQDAWNSALAEARSKLLGQQVGVRGLRAYASHVR